MARRLVYAFVLLQAAFLVCSEDAETSTENAVSASASTTTPTMSVLPTRVSAGPPVKPPLVHNALNASETTLNATIPKNNTEPKKSGASSPNAYMQIVMVSILGVVLCGSAI